MAREVSMLPYQAGLVQSVRNLTQDIKMYRLRLPTPLCSLPGQYVMIWIPGVGEIPISVALEEGSLISLVIARKGKVTSHIHGNIGEGCRLLIRGPYGNGFKLERGKTLLVGGGYGAAPLLFLARELSRLGMKPDVVLGFRTREQVMLVDEFENYADKLLVSTDNGSLGVKGTAIDAAEKLLDRENYTMVYTCGKEQMMHKLVELAGRRGIKVQASLERIVKCGLGICGACVLEPLGLRVCRDGPVFDGETLLKTQDFGRYWRDPSGRRMPLEEVRW